MRLIRALVVAGTCVSATLLAPSPAGAQTDYYNLDAGRPTRIEDATPTARRELELQLAPLRMDRIHGVAGAAAFRWRVEPKISYGILPLTEIEVRAPVAQVRSGAGARPSTGFASLGVGAMHALNVETEGLPSLALAGEVLLPVGSLAAPRASYSVKGLLTRTFPSGRLHLNVSGGTYSLRPGPPPQTPNTICGLETCPLPPVIVPDLPCSRTPAPDGSGGSLASSARCIAGESVTTSSRSSAVITPPSHGAYWMLGLGLDHVFALASTLVVADLVVERFIGLYDLPSATAEIGLRRQLLSRFVVDIGVSRRFAGTVQSTSATAGLSYGFAPRLPRLPWIGDGGRDDGSAK